MRKAHCITTFPTTDDPRGSGLTVTVPLIASSRTVADTVVFIGTPSLLKILNSQPEKFQIAVIETKELN